MRVPQDRGAAIAPGRGSCSRRRCSRGRCSRVCAGTNRGRRQLEVTVMGRAKLRKVHALLERRGFLGDACRAVDARSPRREPSLRRGVAPAGVPAFAAAMVLGAWCGRPHTPCSARGAAEVARHDPDPRSIDCGWWTPRSWCDTSEPRRRHLSFASASRTSKAAAALVRDRRRSPASCVTSPGLPRE